MTLHNASLVHSFKFCPLCAAPLEQNDRYRKAAAKSCVTHGDFYIGRGAGKEPIVIFKRLGARVHRPRWNAGRPYAQIRCDQTGELFKSQTEIVKKMGLDQGNLSTHLLGKSKATHVHGYTFTIVDVWDDLA